MKLFIGVLFEDDFYQMLICDVRRLVWFAHNYLCSLIIAEVTHLEGLVYLLKG